VFGDQLLSEGLVRAQRTGAVSPGIEQPDQVTHSPLVVRHQFHRPPGPCHRPRVITDLLGGIE
jgi:hypothetical protein